VGAGALERYTMECRERRADDLVRAWCSGSNDELLLHLSPDFRCTRDGAILDRDELLRWRGSTGRAADVELVEVFERYHWSMAVIYDATDEVTGLRHRSSMHVFFADDGLVKFVSVVVAPGVRPSPGESRRDK
jgi:hypothetical protein